MPLHDAPSTATPRQLEWVKKRREGETTQVQGAELEVKLGHRSDVGQEADPSPEEG